MSFAAVIWIKSRDDHNVSKGGLRDSFATNLP